MRQRFHFITILWSIGYLIFVLASFLFFLIPNHEKKLFGYQFYSLHQDYTDVEEQTQTIIVTKPVPFPSLAKDQTILYQDKKAGYTTGIIKRIDLANYTITLQDDTLLTKEQCKGILQYTVSIPAKWISYAFSLLLITHILLLFLLGRQWLKLRAKTAPAHA